MKKIFLSILVSLLSLQAFCVIKFKEESLLSEGKWVKIRVAETGVCKLTSSDLKEMGFSDLSKVKVYGYGGNVISSSFNLMPADDLSQVSTYYGNGFLLFYAKGPISWHKDVTSSLYYLPAINPYSNYGYYFLTDRGGEAPKRVSQEAEETSEKANRITDYTYRECSFKEDFNFVSSGRNWYGDIIKNGEKRSYSHTIPDIITTKEVSARFMYAMAGSGTSSLNVSYNGTKMTINSSGVSGYTKAVEKGTEISTEPSSEEITYNVTYNSNMLSDYAAIRYYAISAYRALKMMGSYMPFRNPETLEENSYNKFIVRNFSTDKMIWNVTDAENAKIIPIKQSADSATFIKKGGKLYEFVVIDPSGSDFVKAEYVKEVSNQNLHGVRGVTFVIITTPELISEAKRLAEKHEQVDEIKAIVVTPEELYNEFSSGTPDVAAFRRFMKMIYDRADHKDVQLLLFGDGTFDNKGLLKQTKTDNYLLTYQSENSLNESNSYSTDDYYALLDDEDLSSISITEGNIDIGVGRLPVSSVSQAKGMVDKIIAYIDEHRFGKWKNRVVLLADDNELTNSNNKFFGFSENIGNLIADSCPAMELKKIYFDAYTREVGTNGNRYPGVEKELTEEINKGVLYLNYIGHSGKTGFSAERVFTQSQASTLYNTNQGFWFTASCEFSRYDDLTPSGGEDLVLNPHGGAIGICSSIRTVFDTQNDKLNQRFVKYFFSRDELGNPHRFGDIYRLAKENVENEINKLCFMLMADPMLRISYPQLNVRTDSIQTLEGKSIDTLRALECVRVYASITDDQGNHITTFNGKANITIYDKEQTLYTRANRYTTPAQIQENRFAYTDRPNILFSGSADVTDGTLSFVFRVPKDINYNISNGRISYYAYDEKNGFDAQGSEEQFMVGGSDTTIVSTDTEGPNVSLYINSCSFRDGDVVNTSPVLYADIRDESGINASGCGIGHDITLSMNGSTEVVVLNNYFAYEIGSYTEGKVAYQLSNLTPGEYTLTVKAWDLQNNSTTKQIHFYVVEGTSVSIEDLTIYPNPAKDKTTLLVSHNRPQTKTTYKMIVLDMVGRVIYESDEVSEVSTGQIQMEWDLTDNSGAKIQQGAYVCKVLLSADGCEEKQKSQILIVLPQ